MIRIFDPFIILFIIIQIIIWYVDHFINSSLYLTFSDQPSFFMYFIY